MVQRVTPVERFSKLSRFLFYNEWLHGFQGFYVRCEEV